MITASDTPVSNSAPAGGKPPSVALVRGDAFVARRYDLPAGTSAQEVAGFVALQLEELSPFPLDQLYHGHAVASDRRAVFVYAAYRRRFPASETEHWSDVEFVLPEFVAALRLKFPSTTAVLVRTDITLTALLFDADRELPSRIACRPLAPDAPSDVVAQVRATVLALVDAGSAREVALRVKAPPTRRAKGLQFFFEPDGPGTAREVFIPSGDCWALDVRDPEFIAEQRQRQGFDVMLWRVVLGAAAVVALLLFGELLLGGSLGYASWLRGRNRDRAPDVATLEARMFESGTLREFGESGARPFDMLLEISRVRRGPDGRSLVTLTRATIKGATTLEFVGNSPDLASVNAYEAALRALPQIESVLVKESGTGGGGVTVTFTISFRPRNDLETPAVARNSPP